MLVLAKRRIIYKTWPDEVKKWGFDFKLAIVHGSQAKKLKALNSDADVYLMTYESLFWLYRQDPKLSAQWDMLVCDESSKIKSWSAKRSRILRKHLDDFDRRYCLTGSLQPNSEMDIFNPTYTLDFGQRLGTFITAYRNRWFYPSGYEGHDWKLQDGSADDIADRVSDIWLRFGDEQLQLPELSYVERRIDLAENARRIYDELEDEFIAEIDAGIIVAPNAGVASGKMRQITGGALYTRPVADGEKARERPWESVDEEKLDELDDLITDLNGLPLLIAYEYDHERQRIQKRIPDMPCIGGGTSDAEANRLIDAWNAGELPYLLGQPAAIAHGLNLQGPEASICFFALGWNYENHDQFIRRVWRQGQRAAVIVYYLVATDTVDEDQVASLEKKEQRQHALYEAIRKRNRQRRKGPETMAKKKTPAQHAAEARRDARLKTVEETLKADASKPKAKTPKATKAKTPKAKTPKATKAKTPKATKAKTPKATKAALAKAATKRTRLRIAPDFRVKRTKSKPDEGSIFESLYKCVHASGSTELAKMVEPFMKKPGVTMSKDFSTRNGGGANARLAFTRSYVLRSLRRGYLVAA